MCTCSALENFPKHCLKSARRKLKSALKKMKKKVTFNILKNDVLKKKMMCQGQISFRIFVEEFFW